MATCLGREVSALRVLPASAAAGHLSRALVGAQNRSESTSVVLGYGKLSQELLRVVSELEKPRFKELKCGREE